MNFFALYLRLDLTAKPEWFDSVREKYSSTSILHITLIQPRYIEENRIQDLKNRIEKIIGGIDFNVEDKKLFFDNTEMEKEKDGSYLFMWCIKQNKSITELQKSLVEELKDLNNYCDDETKEYESNFRPHLTVADKIIDPSEIRKLLSQPARCEGALKDLALAIVKNQSIEERESVTNLTLFNL